MAAACSSLLTRSAARRLRPCCIADPGPYRAPASRRGVFETRPSRTQSLRRPRISGAPRRADTVRAGLQERVRRVVLHRIRDTHTILADQWRHECRAQDILHNLCKPDRARLCPPYKGDPVSSGPAVVPARTANSATPRYIIAVRG